jgi:chemosensory pili system protein ChpA (sensor histidine kinase/response regulator)
VFGNIDRDVLIGFVEEVRGNLPLAVDSIETFKADLSDVERLRDAHRVFHSTKGAASMVGLAALSHISYFAEEVVEEIMEGVLPPTPDAVGALVHTIVQIESYLEALLSGSLRERPLVESVVARFRRLRNLPESGDDGAIRDVLTASADLSLLTVQVANVPPMPPPAPMAHHLDSRGGVTIQPLDADEELLDAFREESEGYLVIVKEKAADTEPSRRRLTFEEIRRASHTLKGAAGMVGFQAVNRLASMMESTAERVVSEKLPWSPEISELYVETADLIGRLLRLNGDDPPLGLVGNLYGRWKNIEALSALPAAPPASEAMLQTVVAVAGETSDPEAMLRTTVDVQSSGEIAAAADISAAEISDADPELLEAFMMEAEEHLEVVSRQLRVLDRDPADRQAAEEIRRSVHTLKGAAGMVGFRGISRIAHRMEDLFDRFKDGGLALDREVMTTLFRASDALQDLLKGDRSDTLRSNLAELSQSFDRFEQFAPAASPAVAAGPSVTDSFSSIVADEVDPEFLEVFSIEAEEHMQTIFRRLRDLEADPKDSAAILDIRRSVHTLKGSAGMVGLKSVSRLAHRMEDVFDRVVDGSLLVTQPTLALFFSTADVLEDLVHGGGTHRLREELPGLYQQYDRILGTPQPAVQLPTSVLESFDEEAAAGPTDSMETTGETSFELGSTGFLSARARSAAAVPKARSGQVIRVPIERLDDVVKMVSELIVNRTTFEQYFRNLIQEVDELNLSLARLRSVAGKLETQLEVAGLGGMNLASLAALPTGTLPQAPKLHVKATRMMEFDALEFDRYTDLHLLSRELSETATDINAIGSELGGSIADFDSVLTQLGRLTSDVQDKLLRLRMLPVGTLTARLDRTVRVTATAKGKLVDFSVIGEDVELDKTVVEEMADPLLHILRNAVDHGIEPPNIRRTFGKPERGQIRMLAYQESTQIVIEVRDDGGGLDIERIRAKVVGQGLASDTEAAVMGDDELIQYIFAPGFSTAREVSEISGRGVGMDVVKTTVTKLKGTVTVQSVPGRGTAFIIRLPMTLAVARVLLVRAAGETYAIPFAGVSQILRVDSDMVGKVGNDPVVTIGGKVLPLVNLSKALGGRQTSMLDAESRQPVVVITIEGKLYAVMVDDVLEAREVVVKNLGTLLRRVHGVSGATLTGDGGVVLILNMPELIRESPGRAERIQRAPAPARETLDVLVVDDSVSVRRVVSNLMKNAGFNPIAAKDGVEALELIQNAARLPDIILSDVEMPRMDGYELVSTLQSQETFRHIPVVMITSRAGEQHRQKAFNLGVSEYLVKPYQDEILLGVIRRLIRQKG